MSSPPLMRSKLNLALVALAALSGCREVTIVSFEYAGSGTPPVVDRLLVSAPPEKTAVQLNNLRETVGFIDLRGPLTIIAWGCSGADVVLYGEANYPPRSERITVRLEVTTGASCPQPKPDGSLPHLGAGGGGGMTIAPGTGGAAGDGPDAGRDDGGAGMTDSGGATGSGGAAGSGGNDGGDAGTGGAAGECDDGGVHDAEVAAPACEPPTGPATANDVPMVTVTQDCSNYCASIFSNGSDAGLVCPDLYLDRTNCDRFCTQAGLIVPTDNVPFDNGDNLKCRQRNFTTAAGAMPGVGRSMACDSAGPVGSQPNDCQTGDVCDKFCRAWAGICGRTSGGPGDAGVSACAAVCRAGPLAKRTCRVPWLLKAASDTRYCRALDPNNPGCVIPGC